MLIVAVFSPYVALIVTVPSLTPVTTPASTVAIVSSLEVHVIFSVTGVPPSDKDNVVVLPTLITVFSAVKESPLSSILIG